MVLSGSYSWKQTQDEVEVSIPLKGASKNALDIYASRLYIKVNFKPYLINIDLWKEIDDESEIATIKDNVLLLKYQKLTREMWPDLQCENHEVKSEMRTRRMEAMEEKQERIKLADAKKKEMRAEMEKASTRAQMKIDEVERQTLEDLKAEEKRKAEESVYETFRSLEESKTTQIPATVAKESASPKKGILKTATSPKSMKARTVSFSDDGDEEIPPLPVVDSDVTLDIENEKDSNNIFTEDDVINNNKPAEKPPQGQVKKAATEQEPIGRGDDLETVLPEPRQAARVKLSFTPRVFNTPMRESKKEEEEDWLLRNRKHLTGKARQRLEGIDISERNPMWLKGKGDDFFTQGNFEGALNAYTCALELDEKLVSCLSNRAACFLKLGHFDRCVQDCKTALEIIKVEREEELALAHKEGFAEPPKELKRTRAMRKKLRIRMGTAFNHLEKFNEALVEYQLAQEIEPDDQELKADVARLTCQVQSVAQKELGDIAFREKNYEKALAYYTKALEFNPESVSSYANRSACHLKQNNHEAVVEDCQKALQFVSGDESSSEKNQTLRPKLLARLGGSQLHLDLLEQALQTYTELLHLNPSDLNVAKRVKSIELSMQQQAM